MCQLTTRFRILKDSVSGDKVAWLGGQDYFWTEDKAGSKKFRYSGDLQIRAGASPYHPRVPITVVFWTCGQ